LDGDVEEEDLSYFALPELLTMSKINISKYDYNTQHPLVAYKIGHVLGGGKTKI